MEEEGKASGEIMPDVIPTSQSYRDAVSPPPSRKWTKRTSAGAPLGEKAVKSEPLGEERLGDNAGESAASSSGAGGLPTAAVEDATMDAADAGEDATMEAAAGDKDEEPESHDSVMEQAREIFNFVTSIYTDESRIFNITAVLV